MLFCSLMQLQFNELIPGSASSSKTQPVFNSSLEGKKTKEAILPQVALSQSTAWLLSRVNRGYSHTKPLLAILDFSLTGKECVELLPYIRT